MTEPDPEHVEEIEVPLVADEQPPGRGDLDPGDDYREGVDLED